METFVAGHIRKVWPSSFRKDHLDVHVTREMLWHYVVTLINIKMNLKYYCTYMENFVINNNVSKFANILSNIYVVITIYELES